MDRSEKIQDISFREILTIFFKYKILIAVIFITIMTSVYAGVELRTPQYTASVRLLVAGEMQRDMEYVRSLGQGSLVKTYMELVSSRPVLERVVKALKLDERPLDYEKKYTTKFKQYIIERRLEKERLKLDKMTPEEIKAFRYNNAYNNLFRAVSKFPAQKNSSIFEIRATDFSPSAAVKIANVLSRSFIIFDLEQQIAELQLMYGNKNITIRKLKQHIENLKKSLDGRMLSDIEALGPASVKIISQAQNATQNPLRPGKSNALVIAFVMSMVVSMVFVFLLEHYNPTFKTPQEIERTLKIPYLGSIPKRKPKENSFIKHINPTTKYSYSFQNIAEDMYILMKDKNARSLLITDTRVSESTSVIICNIATFLTNKIKQTVLIIEANVKSATLAKVLGIENSPGLIEVLEGKKLFEDVVRKVDNNFHVITSGGSEAFHSAALLECSKMKYIIEKAKENYDMVIVDYACLKQYCDAIILSTLADAALIIINDGQSRKSNVIAAVDFMKDKRIQVIGAVLNNRKFILPEIIYKMT